MQQVLHEEIPHPPRPVGARRAVLGLRHDHQVVTDDARCRIAVAATLGVEKFERGGGSQAEAEQAVRTLEREFEVLKAALLAHRTTDKKG